MQAFLSSLADSAAASDDSDGPLDLIGVGDAAGVELHGQQHGHVGGVTELGDVACKKVTKEFYFVLSITEDKTGSVVR